MKLSSLIPSALKSSQSSSTAKSSQEPKPKSHSFMGGALSALTGRRASSKVHPEPMQQQEPQRRVSLPTSRRTQSYGHQPVASTPTHKPAQHAVGREQPTRAQLFGTPAKTSRAESLARLDQAHANLDNLGMRPPRQPVQQPVRSEQHTKVIKFLADIDEMLKGPSKERHQLLMKLDYGDEVLTGAQIEEFQARLGEVNKRRDTLIAARKEGLALIDFFTKPTSFPQVQLLMQLNEVQGPLQEAANQRDMIRGNMAQMRQHRNLLGQREELLEAQARVKKTFDEGGFSGLPPAELKQMKQLANMDVNEKFADLEDLDGVVKRTNAALEAMGGGKLFQGRPTTKAERDADDRADRERDEAIRDNGYR